MDNVNDMYSLIPVSVSIVLMLYISPNLIKLKYGIQ